MCDPSLCFPYDDVSGFWSTVLSLKVISMVAVVREASEDYLTQDINNPSNDSVWLLLRTLFRGKKHYDGFLITNDGAHFYQCLQLDYKVMGSSGYHGPFMEFPNYYKVPVQIVLRNMVKDPPERWLRALTRLCYHWAERHVGPEHD